MPYQCPFYVLYASPCFWAFTKLLPLPVQPFTIFSTKQTPVSLRKPTVVAFSIVWASIQPQATLNPLGSILFRYDYITLNHNTYLRFYLYFHLLQIVGFLRVCEPCFISAFPLPLLYLGQLTLSKYLLDESGRPITV